MRHRYEEDDVQEILKRAMHIETQTQTRHDALRISAAELGISEEALAQAELQYMQEKKERDELEEFKSQHRRGFWEHLTSYVIVNGFLLAINLLNFNGHYWALYPILGWGIGLAFHSISALNPRSEEFQKEFDKWKRRRDRRNAPNTEDEDREAARASRRERRQRDDDD